MYSIRSTIEIEKWRWKFQPLQKIWPHNPWNDMRKGYPTAKGSSIVKVALCLTSLSIPIRWAQRSKELDGTGSRYGKRMVTWNTNARAPSMSKKEPFERKQNEAYREVIQYLQKTSQLMKRLGRGERWKNYRKTIHDQHRRKKNLIAMLEKIDWEEVETLREGK